MSTRRRFLVIANPISGGGTGARAAYRKDVFEALNRHEATVELRETGAPGDARIIAEEILESHQNQFDAVIACGGDGTVQQVAQAIAAVHLAEPAKSLPMGLVPAGRCNDFARALKLPTEPDAVARVLREGTVRRADMGRVGEHLFCTVATLGFDAVVTRFVDRMKARLRGTPAYLYGAARVLVSYRAQPVTIRGEFGELTSNLFLLSTGNTSTYGGSIPIVPMADPFDGKFHLCLIDSSPIFKRVSTMVSVLRGRHGGFRHVRFLESSWVEVSATPPMEIWADGEPVGDTSLRIEVVPEALPIILN